MVFLKITMVLDILIVKIRIIRNLRLILLYKSSVVQMLGNVVVVVAVVVEKTREDL